MSPDRTEFPAAADVVIKGVRDEPSHEDGRRVLVDRLWPRGVSKERAALDAAFVKLGQDLHDPHIFISLTNALRSYFAVFFSFAPSLYRLA